jgi:hypothetical protein
MQLRAMRFGAETFALPFADADEVEALRRTDPQAALALARRRNRPNMGDQSTLHVPMSFCDHLPPELARMAERMSQESNTMSNTVTLRDGSTVTVADVENLRARVAFFDGIAARAGIDPALLPGLVADAVGRHADLTAHQRRVDRFQAGIKSRGGVCA